MYTLALHFALLIHSIWDRTQALPTGTAKVKGRIMQNADKPYLRNTPKSRGIDVATRHRKLRPAA